MDHAHPQIDADEPHRRSRRAVAVGVGAVALVVMAVLAFGVFGVQTLFVDDAVDEAGPAFRSGATSAPAPETDADAPSDGDETATTVPQVSEAAQGSFTARDHPGEGTAVVLTDGQQAFVRFEEDFATDNGPDLFVLVVADGETVELGRLKGNRGAQNYELPASIDPSAVTEVSVWCKRFDSTFTVAPLG